jgi:hypothetical protein
MKGHIIQLQQGLYGLLVLLIHIQIYILQEGILFSMNKDVLEKQFMQ